MRMSFLGAAHMVTGSCYLIETNDKKFLVDCGMFQGAKRIRELNYEEFPFSPAELDCVVLTHAHVDHCGLIPKLCKEGFKGEVYATKVTCDLARIMLPDSAYIQQSDAEMLNRKGRRRGDAPIEALYSVDDAQDAINHFVPVSYDDTIAIFDHVNVTFRDAGHIIGSAILEIEVTEGGKTSRLMFSGDLGQPDQPILRDPSILHGADFLVIESTYGDRLHKLYDKETALLEIINDTMDRGGNLVIPAFAVGRTQTLLYYFYKLWKEGRLDSDIPIILDSPLAIAATRVFLQNMHVFDEETMRLLNSGEKLLQFPQLHVC
ncbi:MAG: MBL fold metallo-hydrolase, partial [Selenomonadaceae bacterium]|nr:MBL fold metallo-hydrolase [Selenomonadaceae bacterium]